MDRRWILAAGVAAASVLAGIWWGRGVTPVGDLPPAVLPTSGSTVAANAPNDTIVVHVAGWVLRPGLVEVPKGSRVGAALAAAGGLRPGASFEALNLATVLSDGQQVHVPGPGAVHRSAEAPDAETRDDGGMIHLNSATVADLESLPGVGPVLAERILAHREDHGDYESVEDLLEVAGIGEAKLNSIRDLVVVP